MTQITIEASREDVEGLREEVRFLRSNGWHGWEDLERLASRIEAALEGEGEE